MKTELLQGDPQDLWDGVVHEGVKPEVNQRKTFTNRHMDSLFSLLYSIGIICLRPRFFPRLCIATDELQTNDERSGHIF